MLEVDPVALVFQGILSAALGWVLGVGAKKMMTVLALFVGVQLMVIRYLEASDIVVIHWNRFTGGIVGEAHWIESVLSVVTVGGSFAGGFLLGYHRA